MDQPVRVVVAIVEQPGGKFLCGRTKVATAAVKAAQREGESRP